MKKNGYFLVEIVVALGVFSIIIFSIIQLFLTSQEASGIGQKKTKATFLIDEYFEDLRSVRRDSWDNLLEGRFVVATSSGSLVLVPTTKSEEVDDYTRYLLIEKAYRDVSGKLVDTGGTEDPSTKKITVVVSWGGLHSAEISQISYLTRFMDNLVWKQTAESDFKAGTNKNTAVTNIDGGEVILGAGGQGQWCAPYLSTAELDLPKQGVANCISAIEGHVSVGTGENASGVSYAHVTVSNTDPPVPTLEGTFNGYKTNDIWGDGHYAYLATDNNQKEVVIIDLSSFPYQEVGFFNIPGNKNGTSIYISGNRGFVTTDRWLYIFDLSQKTGSRPQLGFPFLMLGRGTSIVVKGDYAYVSLANSAIELQIMNITNPWYIFSLGYADVNGQDGKRVFINDSSTRAYLVTNASESLREFFIIDISSKSGLRPVISSYDANGMNPKNLAVVTGNKAIIVGTGGEEYQVIDISKETTPIRCGGLQVNLGINGISSVLEVDGDAYSYIITGDAQNELKIIEGGPGGQYASSGYFESKTLDAGHSSAFNRLFVNFETPSQTSIKFQAAVKDPIGGTCQNVTFDDLDFIGPDKTAMTYFTHDSAIPLDDDGTGYENPSQCLRFRAYLATTDPSQTPTLYDFSVNYSP